MKESTISEQRDIVVFRAGHRPFRDKRITTHVALVSRAFGASRILVDTKDEELEITVNRVTKEFGGNFTVQTGINWTKRYSSFKGVRIYLTMYGENLNTAMPKILARAKNENIAILVGAEKMPPSAYSLSDFNVAVTNQPHSEVAALAMFLDRLLEGNELKNDLRGHMNVIPAERGKDVRILPDRNECLKILSEHNASEKIIKHSLAVCELSMELAKLADADLRLVEAGALLHDIGRTKTQGVDHCAAGAAILREASLISEVVNIVERHTGGGILPEEAEKLGMPPGYYMPETLEEKIVAHADNLFKGTIKVRVQTVIDNYEKKGLHDSAVRISKLHSEIAERCGKDPDEIDLSKSKSISYD